MRWPPSEMLPQFFNVGLSEENVPFADTVGAANRTFPTPSLADAKFSLPACGAGADVVSTHNSIRTVGAALASLSQSSRAPGVLTASEVTRLRSVVAEMQPIIADVTQLTRLREAPDAVQELSRAYIPRIIARWPTRRGISVGSLRFLPRHGVIVTTHLPAYVHLWSLLGEPLGSLCIANEVSTRRMCGASRASTTTDVSRLRLSVPRNSSTKPSALNDKADAALAAFSFSCSFHRQGASGDILLSLEEKVSVPPLNGLLGSVAEGTIPSTASRQLLAADRALDRALDRLSLPVVAEGVGLYFGIPGSATRSPAAVDGSQCAFRPNNSRFVTFEPIVPGSEPNRLTSSGSANPLVSPRVLREGGFGRLAETNLVARSPSLRSAVDLSTRFPSAVAGDWIFEVCDSGVHDALQSLSEPAVVKSGATMLASDRAGIGEVEEDREELTSFKIFPKSVAASSHGFHRSISPSERAQIPDSSMVAASAGTAGPDAAISLPMLPIDSQKPSSTAGARCTLDVGLAGAWFMASADSLQESLPFNAVTPPDQSRRAATLGTRRSALEGLRVSPRALRTASFLPPLIASGEGGASSNPSPCALSPFVPSFHPLHSLFAGTNNPGLIAAGVTVPPQRAALLAVIAATAQHSAPNPFVPSAPALPTSSLVIPTAASSASLVELQRPFSINSISSSPGGKSSSPSATSPPHRVPGTPAAMPSSVVQLAQQDALDSGRAVPPLSPPARPPSPCGGLVEAGPRFIAPLARVGLAVASRNNIASSQPVTGSERQDEKAVDAITAAGLTAQAEALMPRPSESPVAQLIESDVAVVPDILPPHVATVVESKPGWLASSFTAHLKEAVSIDTLRPRQAVPRLNDSRRNSGLLYRGLARNRSSVNDLNVSAPPHEQSAAVEPLSPRQPLYGGYGSSSVRAGFMMHFSVDAAAHVMLADDGTAPYYLCSTPDRSSPTAAIGPSVVSSNPGSWIPTQPDSSIAVVTSSFSPNRNDRPVDSPAPLQFLRANIPEEEQRSKLSVAEVSETVKERTSFLSAVAARLAAIAPHSLLSVSMSFPGGMAQSIHLGSSIGGYSRSVYSSVDNQSLGAQLGCLRWAAPSDPRQWPVASAYSVVAAVRARGAAAAFASQRGMPHLATPAIRPVVRAFVPYEITVSAPASFLGSPRAPSPLVSATSPLPRPVTTIRNEFTTRPKTKANESRAHVLRPVEISYTRATGRKDINGAGPVAAIGCAVQRTLLPASDAELLALATGPGVAELVEQARQPAMVRDFAVRARARARGLLVAAVRRIFRLRNGSQVAEWQRLWLSSVGLTPASLDAAREWPPPEFRSPCGEASMNASSLRSPNLAPFATPNPEAAPAFAALHISRSPLRSPISAQTVPLSASTLANPLHPPPHVDLPKAASRSSGAAEDELLDPRNLSRRGGSKNNGSAVGDAATGGDHDRDDGLVHALSFLLATSRSLLSGAGGSESSSSSLSSIAPQTAPVLTPELSHTSMLPSSFKGAQENSFPRLPRRTSSSHLLSPTSRARVQENGENFLAINSDLEKQSMPHEVHVAAPQLESSAAASVSTRPFILQSQAPLLVQLDTLTSSTVKMDIVDNPEESLPNSDRPAKRLTEPKVETEIAAFTENSAPETGNADNWARVCAAAHDVLSSIPVNPSAAPLPDGVRSIAELSLLDPSGIAALADGVSALVAVLQADAAVEAVALVESSAASDKMSVPHHATLDAPSIPTSSLTLASAQKPSVFVVLGVNSSSSDDGGLESNSSAAAARLQVALSSLQRTVLAPTAHPGPQDFNSNALGVDLDASLAAALAEENALANRERKGTVRGSLYTRAIGAAAASRRLQSVLLAMSLRISPYECSGSVATRTSCLSGAVPDLSNFDGSPVSTHQSSIPPLVQCSPASRNVSGIPGVVVNPNGAIIGLAEDTASSLTPSPNALSRRLGARQKTPQRQLDVLRFDEMDVLEDGVWPPREIPSNIIDGEKSRDFSIGQQSRTPIPTTPRKQSLSHPLTNQLPQQSSRSKQNGFEVLQCFPGPPEISLRALKAGRTAQLSRRPATTALTGSSHNRGVTRSDFPAVCVPAVPPSNLPGAQMLTSARLHIANERLVAAALADRASLSMSRAQAIASAIGGPPSLSAPLANRISGTRSRVLPGALARSNRALSATAPAQ